MKQKFYVEMLKNIKIRIGVVQEKKCGDFGYQSVNGTQIIGMTTNLEISFRDNTDKHLSYLRSGRNATSERRRYQRISVAQFKLNNTAEHHKTKLCLNNVFGQHQSDKKNIQKRLKKFISKYKYNAIFNSNCGWRFQCKARSQTEIR